MPIERFYVDADLATGTTVAISGPELHHLSHVVRLRPPEEAELVNGRGALATAKLLRIDTKKAELQILRATHTPPPSPFVTLVVGMPRFPKLEWIIEKGTELGADAFFLFPSDCSENKIERLRNLTIAALKQSGRLFLPPIHFYPNLKSCLQDGYTLYFGDTRPTAPLLMQTELKMPILFATGPEEGFTKEEIAILEAKRAIGVKLHKNILRAETAPLAALAVLAQI
jgi:16S rRNA (uracil1498-N3)-methyltransferase